MRHIHNFLLLGTVLFIASCGSAKQEEKAENNDLIPVRVMALQATDIGGQANISGQFTTDDEAMLSFKTGGIISRIYVREGDAIQAGQLLATLNMTEINAQVTIARTAYDKASRDYARVLNLYKDSVATLEQKENAETALEIAKQQYAAAEFNRNYSQIRSTRSGYVLRKLASEGQLAEAGTPVFQVNGAQSGTWKLKAGVSDREWAMIRVGDKATISVAALSNKQYNGVVCRRSEGADPQTGSFTVDIKFLGEQPAVAAGMFGKATVQTTASTQRADQWAIPYDALLDGDGNTGYVFVTNDKKNARKIEVAIASIEKDKLIVADGLQNARWLIVSGSAYLTDSSKIKITN